MLAPGLQQQAMGESPLEDRAAQLCIGTDTSPWWRLQSNVGTATCFLDWRRNSYRGLVRNNGKPLGRHPSCLQINETWRRCSTCTKTPKESTSLRNCVDGEYITGKPGACTRSNRRRTPRAGWVSYDGHGRRTSSSTSTECL